MLIDKNMLMKLSKNKKFEIVEYTENVINFLSEFSYYYNLAISNFLWDSDTEIMNLDNIECINFFNGSCALVYDISKGYRISPYEVSKFNSDGDILAIRTMPFFSDSNEKNEEFEDKDFVIIKNMFNYAPTFLTVAKYCNILNDCDLAIGSNLKKQKFPIVLEGENEQKLTLQNLAKQIDEDSPFLFLKKSFAKENIGKLDIAPNFDALSYCELKKIKDNELLTKLGINNENINKLSGVSEEEIQSNNDKVERSFQLFASVRDKAIKEIKEKFDITLSYTTPQRRTVEYNSTFTQGGVGFVTI